MFINTENKKLATYQVQVFGSVAELVATMEAPFQRRHNDYLRVKFLGERSGMGRDWYGLKGGAAAVKAAMRDGYAEGADKVTAIYERIEAKLPRAVDFRRTRRRADAGDALDIHAVNRGDLSRAWETMRRDARHGSGLVRIVADVCGNAGMDADELTWRGVAALALSRALTRAGYSVEIVAAAAVGASMNFRRDEENKIPLRRSSLTLVTVKPRHAAADTLTLAATLCLPGFFRTYLFCGIVRAADLQGTESTDYLGHAVDAASLIPADSRVVQVIVPAHVTNEQAAADWVKQAIALAQGATLAKERA